MKTRRRPGAAGTGKQWVVSLRTAARRTLRAAIGAAVLVAAFFGPLAAANPTPSASIATDSVSSTSIPARELAAECANNEILVIQHPGSYLRYRLHEVNDKGDQIRDQIETPDGSVARLIQHDGRALTPEEDAEERERLNNLLASPSTFTRHVKNDQANKRLGIDLLKLLPDAMLWSYAPGQPQLQNQPAGDSPLVVIDFKPNPNWSPPSIPAEPLTGLEGRVWIDSRSHRMVRIDGDLFHAVNIGWGMVAHIYPGGTVTLHQTNVQGDPGGERFIVDHIIEQLTLRALMVKTVKQRLVFDTADFRPVPAMTYQQAIRILLDTPPATH